MRFHYRLEIALALYLIESIPCYNTVGVVLFVAAVAAQWSSAAGETAEKVSEKRKCEREQHKNTTGS